MKTLFQYGSQLNSRDLNLALASLIGVGPICGFNEASIQGNILKISSSENASISGIYKHVMWDRVKSRFINQQEAGGNQDPIYHGCIARDGYMYLDTLKDLQVLISNNKSVNHEVLLFAKHIAVSDPVDNPVTLVAYFNTSSDSFYSNYYLPQLSGNIDLLYNTEASGINFQNLEDAAFKAIPENSLTKEDSVLIGIYGTGFNTGSSIQERFSIVPYNGEFPVKLSYNILVHNYMVNLTDKVSRLESRILDLENRIATIG